MEIEQMEFKGDEIFKVGECFYLCSAVIHDDYKIFGYELNNCKADEKVFNFSQIEGIFAQKKCKCGSDIDVKIICQDCIIKDEGERI